jgi:hypothetical protein
VGQLSGAPESGRQQTAGMILAGKVSRSLPFDSLFVRFFHAWMRLPLLSLCDTLVLMSGLRFGHVDHVDQAVHMDILGGLENGPHMVHMVHIPLFEPRG